MIYQNVLCIGDSQTIGARTYLGYPEWMAQVLTKSTGMEWNCINAGVNGETTVEILRRTQRDFRQFYDVFIICLLAGTNDTRMDRRTPVMLFEQAYDLLLRAVTYRETVVYAGLIPVIQRGYGHIPYDEKSRELRESFNEKIRLLCNRYGAKVVETDMGKECYADSVHFNERGNEQMAIAFTNAILRDTEGHR